MKRKPDWNNFWLKNPIIFSKAFFKLYTMLRIKAYLRLLRAIDLDGKTTLELGGGSGYLSKLLSEKRHTKPSVIDNNKNAYDFSKRIGNFEVNYFLQDMFSHKGKYDVVFSDGLIEHFYPKERKKVFTLHKKLLKKDGYCVIFVPKKSLLIESLGMKNEYEEKFTLERLKKEAESVGLKVLASTSDFHMIGILCK